MRTHREKVVKKSQCGFRVVERLRDHTNETLMRRNYEKCKPEIAGYFQTPAKQGII